MQKIIFTSPTLKYPPIGGPALRIFNSLIALSEISKIHILLQNPDVNIVTNKIDSRYIHIFRKKKILFQNIHTQFKNINRIVDFIIIRYPFLWKKIIYFIRAKQIVDYACKNKIRIIWFGYGNVSYDLIKFVKFLNPNLKLVCDTDSVWSRYVLRRIKYEKEMNKVLLIRKEGVKKIHEEKELIKICDVVTAVSNIDKNYYLKIANIKNRDKIKIFPNVINRFDYKKISKVSDIPTGKYIYMSGSFGFETPMEDASIWFIENIFPILKKFEPKIKLLIVGNNADSVLAKYRNRKNILIKGWVSSTVPYLKMAKVSIVPLRYESGTRFKILESGICSVPVVSTFLGAEGLELINNKDIILTDNPRKFAQSIYEILISPIKAKKLSKNLHHLVVDNYSIDSLVSCGYKILKFLE